MTKQRILFITTGGTIASVHTPQGLRPVLSSDETAGPIFRSSTTCASRKRWPCAASTAPTSARNTG